MKTEKKQTYKYLKEKHTVSSEVKKQLKYYTKMKNAILKALENEDLTINQLSEKLSVPKDELMYYLMSLLKFNLIQTGEIDDMDEYFTYKRIK